MTKIRKNRIGFPLMQKHPQQGQDTLDFELHKLEIRQAQSEYLADRFLQITIILILLRMIGLFLNALYHDIASLFADASAAALLGFRTPWSKDEEEEEEENPRAEQLAGHLPTEDITGNDTFKDSDARTEKINAYTRIQKQNAPKTIEESGRTGYLIAQAAKALAHLVSFLTVVGFVWAVGCYVSGLNPSNPSGGTLLNYISLGLFLGIIGVASAWNEYEKSQSLNRHHYRRAKNLEGTRKDKNIYRATVAISVLASIAGGCLLTYAITDQSASINDTFNASRLSIEQKRDADVAAREKDLQGRIDNYYALARQESEKAKTLRSERVMWKGKPTMPERNRRAATKADDRAADYIAKASELQSQKDQVAGNAKTSAAAAIAARQAEADLELSDNAGEVLLYVVIGFIIILIVEGGGWLATSAIFRYRIAVETEGKKYGILKEKQMPVEAGLLEVMKIRQQQILAAQQYVMNGGTGFQRVTPTAQSTSGIMGFATGYNQQPTPSPTPAPTADQLNEMSAKVETLQSAIDELLKNRFPVRSDEPKNTRSKNFTSHQADWFNSEDAKEGRKTQKRAAQVKAERAKHLREQGKTIKEIAKKMKCSESTIKRYLKA